MFNIKLEAKITLTKYIVSNIITEITIINTTSVN